jgi:hypothetical protein
MVVVGAFAQTPKCELKRQPFINKGSSTGTMTLEQGGICQFKFRFNEINAPDSWQLVDPPKSGKVVFEEDTARYEPAEGFVGEDQFTVALSGRAANCSTACFRNGRFAFSVTVKPKP